MLRHSDSELKPRNGHTLVVGLGARISGCASQTELSLEDQLDHGREAVAEMYKGPVEFRIISTKGKGEALDRPELAEIERELASGELDLFVFEDLGRLARGYEAVRLLGVGVDHGTRTIILNDDIDTADPNWEEDALTASAGHVGHNSHTSKRLKQKLMNRFDKFGGATARPPYGYLIPDGAKTYDKWQRDPSATPIIQDAARHLVEHGNCSAVADCLNRKLVPTGPYCRTDRWNGQLVRHFFANPILKGIVRRGVRVTVKRHETGRRVSIKNTKAPHALEYAHLAHLDPALFDELNARLDMQNRKLGRKPVNGADPRYRVPRKRTRFPGQHARCLYCGRECVWGGNGITGNLMCVGARVWNCWNAIGFDGALAAKKLVEVIVRELAELDQFDEQFRVMVTRARNTAGSDLNVRRQRLEKDQASLLLQRENAKAAIAKCGPHSVTLELLQEIDAKQKRLSSELYQLEQLQVAPVVLPDSVAELRNELLKAFEELAIDSIEFGELMRKLVASFYVYLVRLCDGGHLLPRARVTLALDGILPSQGRTPSLTELLRREIEIDLFIPTQRERIREQAAALAAQGLSHKAIAGQLPEKPTPTAVSNALALDRKMQEMGLASPYLVVQSPPDDYSKLRRHKNARFCFKPLDGYQPPLI